MQVAASATTVTVEPRRRRVEKAPTFHTDMDRSEIEQAAGGEPVLVVEFAGDAGVAGGGGGLERLSRVGDHASNSFSVDGQPITDQQSKVFRIRLPSNAVQSLEVIEVRRRRSTATRPAGGGGDDAIGAGRDEADGECDGVVRLFWHQQRGFDVSMVARSWAISSRWMACRAGVFWMARSSRSSTIMATSRIFSIGWITTSVRRTRCTWMRSITRALVSDAERFREPEWA